MGAGYENFTNRNETQRNKGKQSGTKPNRRISSNYICFIARGRSPFKIQQQRTKSFRTTSDFCYINVIAHIRMYVYVYIYIYWMYIVRARTHGSTLEAIHNSMNETKDLQSLEMGPLYNFNL